MKRTRELSQVNTRTHWCAMFLLGIVVVCVLLFVVANTSSTQYWISQSTSTPSPDHITWNYERMEGWVPINAKPTNWVVRIPHVDPARRRAGEQLELKGEYITLRGLHPFSILPLAWGGKTTIALKSIEVGRIDDSQFRKDGLLDIDLIRSILDEFVLSRNSSSSRKKRDGDGEEKKWPNLNIGVEVLDKIDITEAAGVGDDWRIVLSGVSIPHGPDAHFTGKLALSSVKLGSASVSVTADPPGGGWVESTIDANGYGILSASAQLEGILFLGNEKKREDGGDKVSTAEFHWTRQPTWNNSMVPLLGSVYVACMSTTRMCAIDSSKSTVAFSYEKTANPTGFYNFSTGKWSVGAYIPVIIPIDIFSSSPSKEKERGDPLLSTSIQLSISPLLGVDSNNTVVASAKIPSLIELRSQLSILQNNVEFSLQVVDSSKRILVDGVEGHVDIDARDISITHASTQSFLHATPTLIDATIPPLDGRIAIDFLGERGVPTGVIKLPPYISAASFWSSSSGKKRGGQPQLMWNMVVTHPNRTFYVDMIWNPEQHEVILKPSTLIDILQGDGTPFKLMTTQDTIFVTDGSSPSEAIFSMPSNKREVLWVWINGTKDASVLFVDPILDLVVSGEVPLRLQGEIVISMGMYDPVRVELQKATLSSLIDGSIYARDCRIVLQRGYGEFWGLVPSRGGKNGSDPLHVLLDVPTLHPPTIAVKNLVSNYIETNTQFIIRSIPQLARRLYLHGLEALLSASSSSSPSPHLKRNDFLMPVSLRQRERV